jgi:hypothetical protein
VLFITKFSTLFSVNHCPFAALTTMSSGIFFPLISSLNSLTIYICPSLFRTTSGIGPLVGLYILLNTSGSVVAACFFESSCSSIVVVVVLDYDQQLRQSSSTSSLFRIFLFFKLFMSSVTSRLSNALLPCLHLTTENVVPESLELLALQWLHKKITDHVVGPAVFNLRVSLLYLIGNKEVTNV